MTDSWKTNKETKRDDSGDRVSRFFVLAGDNKIIKKLALIILIIGLVRVCSGIAIGQTSRDLDLLPDYSNNAASAKKGKNVKPLNLSEKPLRCGDYFLEIQEVNLCPFDECGILNRMEILYATNSLAKRIQLAKEKEPGYVHIENLFCKDIDEDGTEELIIMQFYGGTAWSNHTALIYSLGSNIEEVGALGSVVGVEDLDGNGKYIIKEAKLLDVGGFPNCCTPYFDAIYCLENKKLKKCVGRFSGFYNREIQKRKKEILRTATKGENLKIKEVIEYYVYKRLLQEGEEASNELKNILPDKTYHWFEEAKQLLSKSGVILKPWVAPIF